MKRWVQITTIIALAAMGLPAQAQTAISTDQISVSSDQGLPSDWPLELSMPPGARILQMQILDGTAKVDFGPEVIEGLDEATLNWLAEEVQRAFTLAEGINSLRLESQGQLLSSYMKPSKAVGTAAPPPSPMILPDGTEATQGLGGRNITIGPSHGRFWNGSGWYWQRSDPCGLGEAVLEDTNSIRLLQFLYQYLAQDGATVHVARELNEGNCCHGSEGLPWWKMCSQSWLRANGLPCTVWANSSNNCGADTAVNRNSDDIRARPKFADHRGSEIYIAHHTNAGGGGTATGTETFRDTAMENPAHEGNSLNLANNVQSSVIDAIRSTYPGAGSWANRGVKDSNGGFGEIRIPNRPAILIELAFHDGCVGSNDAAYLTDNFFRSVAEWGLYRGVCQYFGTSPTWDKYSDEFVSDTIPTTMISGAVYPVSITFRNRGVVWSEGRAFRLGAAGDSDPFTGTTRHAISGEVRPGNTYTWNFNMTAPAAGVYTTDWQMVRDGYAWFGAVRSKSVTVNPNVDTQAPTTPTNLQATAPNPTLVQLTWTASTDNVGVTGYDIRRDGVIIGSSATNSYNDSTVTDNTAYAYEVRAKDAVPNYSGWSNTANVTTPEVDTTPPSTPTNLVGNATSPTSVQLTWTASTDNVGVTGYDIRRNGSVIGSSATASYTDNSASANTAYAYEVRAKDANNNLSGWSNTANVVTPVAPVTIFQDGFDGSLSNWTQGTAAYDYSTTVNHGTFPGGGAAFMAAGQADQMFHAFSRPFAQGKATGYFWDGKGGWQASVCGWAYRQSLSLRDIDGAAKLIIDNEFYSAANNATYFFRTVGIGGIGHTAYGNRDAGTDCNGTWVKFETTVTPGAGTCTMQATDRAGTSTTTQGLPSDFFAWGFGRITLGLGVTSANEGYWDDISLEASPPGIPTMSLPAVLGADQITWNFSPADSNQFGWDVADAAGTIVSPSWPAAGWLGHAATSWTEGGLAANTSYSRKVKSWNGTLDSQYSGVVNARTLSVAPIAGSVTPDNAAPCAGDSVTWTAVGGFGAGTVEYYAFAWDTNPTYSFVGGEPVWNSGTLVLPATTAGTWYLHVKGYNADDVANGTFDYAVTAADCAPPTVTAAVSRKVQGAGSYDIDVTLATAVECRTGGPTQVVVTFSAPVEGLGGLDNADVAVSSGSVGTVSITGAELTIGLSGVTNGTKLLMSFPGIVSVGGATASPSVLCFGVLMGDATGDGSANVFDLVTIRNNLNAVVNASNFRTDVTCDGNINVFDQVLARNNLNTAVTGSCP